MQRGHASGLARLVDFPLVRVFAIADPHLSRAQAKPMTIFGPNWEGHPQVFFERWRETVGEDDLVLVPGDISWALKLEDAMPDLLDLSALPGQKVLLRGNHDYWWPAIGKLRKSLPRGMYALQNDALRLGGVVVAGTRGWVTPGSAEFGEEDEKIYRRELGRLKLSLASARALLDKGDEKLVIMLHFPPTNPKLEPSGFTDIIQEAKPDALVHGHLHGTDARRVLTTLNGIPCHFVASDALGFRPKLILEL